MSKTKIYPVKESFKDAHITPEKYLALYKESIADPDTFWSHMAKEHVVWHKPWQKVYDADFTKAQVKWFTGGELNVAYNCIDKHLPHRANQTAIIWEPDNPEDDAKHITYQQLYDEVSKFANTLKSLGIKKGDRICIYMPMIPEAAYAMLACARLGAIHSIVFAGFSAEALRGRIEDCDASLVITADEGKRGGKNIPLKKIVDEAISHVQNKDLKTLVVKNTGVDIPMTDRDIYYHDQSKGMEGDCPPEMVEANDPLFILYTSGSTGTPKGVVHGSGGYLLYAALTHKYTFDYKEGEIYWCTADIGWITGHSYIIYGPLCNGATTVMFEGIPTAPSYSRFWQVVERHKVNIFYTAPTAIRSLEAHGDTHVQKNDLSSLRILGTVGEPINPEVWEWYSRVVGHNNCPIVDTWWQTETGGHLITPLPGAHALKPGCALKPFFGVKPVIMDENGKEMDGACEGILCIKGSWPGQMQTVYNNHDRFFNTYFSAYKGYYFTGDGCRRDADGDYWITGRVDDVLNVSGHRMGTAEIESALVLHKNVSEAAVVGFPHQIKGEGIYAYVTLHDGVEPSDELLTELIQLVRSEIGPIATLDAIQFAPGLPKTRSGKIMRRILRKIAHGEADGLGDTSTLADPAVVDDLIKNAIKV